jgi:UDP-glucose 4-epimerase
MSASSKKILLTGGTGFIGKALLSELLNNKFLLVSAVRRLNPNIPSPISEYEIKNIDSKTNWGHLVQDIDTIIHLAARAHILNDTNTDPLAVFREINTEGTLGLARQAASAGVRRFIFISSIGVNGNQTTSAPFTMDDIPVPIEPYAISKLEAEIGLKKIGEKTGMEIVIIRPPLVYGSDAPGNFRRLISLVAKSIPLPLGAIHNRRSFIALDNIVDLIKTCIEHPNAANQTFLASDDDDLSTTELLQRLATSLGKPSHLIPVPAYLLTTAATLLGKRDLIQRLCGSLQVDISHTKQILNWSPPLSVTDALQKTADSYLKQLERK